MHGPLRQHSATNSSHMGDIHSVCGILLCPRVNHGKVAARVAGRHLVTVSGYSFWVCIEAGEPKAIRLGRQTGHAVFPELALVSHLFSC